MGEHARLVGEILPEIINIIQFAGGFDVIEHRFDLGMGYLVTDGFH
jgi:hypothetical protein